MQCAVGHETFHFAGPQALLFPLSNSLHCIQPEFAAHPQYPHFEQPDTVTRGPDNQVRNVAIGLSDPNFKYTVCSPSNASPAGQPNHV